MSNAPFVIWDKGGTTEHIGGVHATRRLLEMLDLQAGPCVLEIGCGTGYTSCLLAGEHQAQVTALDLTRTMVHSARQRAIRLGLREQVGLVQGNAHHLPIKGAAFDCVLVESVLVFCQAEQVLAEIRRAIKPGGWLGVNELTLLQAPSAPLAGALTQLGIQAHQQSEWIELLEHTGFQPVRSQVGRVSLSEQFSSHLQVDGLRGYLASAGRAVRQVSVYRAFFNRQMLSAARGYKSTVGYGLYAAVRPI